MSKQIIHGILVAGGLILARIIYAVLAARLDTMWVDISGIWPAP